MIKLLVLTVILLLLVGCATSRVQLSPRAMSDQKVTYSRGSAKLHSQTALEFELVVLDYSFDEMLIGLSLANTTQNSMTFSEKNVVVSLIASEKVESATVYSFEQLAEKGNGGGGKNAAVLVGRTAAGIGAGFIPFGSIAYTIGSLFYDIGSQGTEGHQERIGRITYSQMTDNYLRQQTIEPGEKYSGVLKIGFNDELGAGDTIIFQVSSDGGVIEKFNFICEEPLQ